MLNLVHTKSLILKPAVSTCGECAVKHVSEDSSTGTGPVPVVLNHSATEGTLHHFEYSKCNHGTAFQVGGGDGRGTVAGGQNWVGRSRPSWGSGQLPVVQLLSEVICRKKEKFLLI